MTGTLDRLRAALGARYTVEREIGRGGMATVFRAIDLRHGRPVALKVMHPELAASIGAERFVKEITVAAGLNHPHILPLLDSGTVDYGVAVACPYYTMPFVEGETLRERLIRERQLPVEDALRLGREIAEALACAHESGVIHRDIKPENILLSNGHAVVADFGIARALTQTGTDRLTSTGIAVGTPAYMSPEQALGEGVIDGRTDIYSLGCLLYEALAGVLPFQGSTAQATLARRLNESAPRLRGMRDAVPESYARAIAKALARVPADRFLTAAAFAQALMPAAIEAMPAYRDPTPGSVSSRPARRAQITMGLLGAGAGALLGASLMWNATRGTDEAQLPGTRLTVELAQDAAVEIESGDRHAPSIALSPDGRRIVFVARGGQGDNQLFLRRMDRFDATPIAGTEGASNPVLSPNGEWVAFLSNGMLKKVLIEGGPSITLCPASDPEGFDWESDNALLLSQYGSALLRVPAEGGVPRATGKLEAGEYWQAWPQVLPGGKTVLYVSSSASGSSIVALTLATGERRVVLKDAAFARFVSSGHLLFLRAGVLLARPFDPERLTLTGVAAPVPEDLRVTDGVVPQMSVSRNGNLAYLPKSAGPTALELVWVDRAGVVTPLPVPPAEYRYPRLSPDGRRIAAPLWQPGTQGEILVLETARDRPSRLTYQGSFSSALWTSNGSRIVFGSVADRASNLFSQAADGSSPARQLLRNPNDQWPGSFSPDGDTLIYMQNDPETHGDIWMASLKSPDKPQPLLRSTATEWGARVSPDGRWLAYVSDELGRFEVFVTSFPVPRAKWRISTDGGQEVVWAINGHEIFYRRPDNTMMAVALDTGNAFSFSNPRALFKGAYALGAPGLPGYDVATDGRFLMMRNEESAVVTWINVVLGWSKELTRRLRDPSS
jgi:eukaryotic-like serine/threonine-protein kinase